MLQKEITDHLNTLQYVTQQCVLSGENNLKIRRVTFQALRMQCERIERAYAEYTKSPDWREGEEG